MRSLVRVIKLLLVCFYLGVKYVSLIAAVEFLLIRQWGLGIGLEIVWMLLESNDDRVKDWAEKN
jgi:hypothetical protein